MPFYGASQSPTAPGTTNDILTLTAAASRIALVHEISISGEGTASAANELIVNRPTTLGITPVAQVPAQFDPDNAASGATVAAMSAANASGWTTQPVLATISLMRLGCNSNGGVYRWVAKPGEEIRLRSNATVSVSQLSLRMGLGGAQQMGVHLIFEDL